MDFLEDLAEEFQMESLERGAIPIKLFFVKFVKQLLLKHLLQFHEKFQEEFPKQFHLFKEFPVQILR